MCPRLINILCADQLTSIADSEYNQSINQSINQRLHYFEFVDSKVANFVLESSVHLCRGERKKLQTLWEPNFILSIINLAACWNFQLMHAVIGDGSLSYVRRSDMLVKVSVILFVCFNRIWVSSNISSSCTPRPHGTFSCSGKPCSGQTSIFIRKKIRQEWTKWSPPFDRVECNLSLIERFSLDCRKGLVLVLVLVLLRPLVG